MSIAPHAPRTQYLPGRFHRHNRDAKPYLDSLPKSYGRVYLELEGMANNHTAEVWALQTKIARLANVCERTTKAALKSLEEQGLIARQRKGRRHVIILLQPGGKGANFAPEHIDIKLDSPKAKDIEPAAARPAAPHRSPNRNIVASSRIARRFCEERRITHPWYRRYITKRIEALLNTGHEEAAIVAQFDREREAADPPRKVLRRQMLERIRLAVRMREGQNLCTWPAAPAAELVENKAEEGEAERPAAPPRVWRSAAQLKAAEERHAESMARWKWFDERIQTDGAVHVEGRMCRTDEDILAVIRWLIPRSQLTLPAAAAFPPQH
jgi:DNA-binding MarR family transcriptional regulator